MSAYIKADRDRCIGAGLCTVAAQHFDIDGGGNVVILDESQVADDDRPIVEDAIAMCPAEAIWLQEQASTDPAEVSTP